MIVRYLEYIVALARERHFARAASACNVTQPTLSAGIKQLEDSMGVLIVERRQRFAGFTAEGERVLAWAQRTLADYRGLEQELSDLRDGLAGQIRIGSIPVGLPIVGLLTSQFRTRHPRAKFQIVSQTSMEIQRGLDDFDIDVGITYLDNEPLARVQTIELYRERYVLVTRDDGDFAGRASATWAQAANLSLCLLTPSMQNRRIVNAYFHAAGVQVEAAIETNSLVTLWSHVRHGQCSVIVPHTFLLLLGEHEGLLALPLTEPSGSHAVGLVAPARDPLLPMTRALLAFAQEMNLARDIEDHIARSWPHAIG